MGRDRYHRRRGRRRRWSRSERLLVYLAATLGFVVVFVAADWLPQFFETSNVSAAITGSPSPSELPTVVPTTNESDFVTVGSNSGQSVRVETMRIDLTVVDGDTVRSGGATYRLVGFNTPESGDQAKCDQERSLAAAATRRLQALVAGGGASLERVACACPSGTEGTDGCNFGRLCGRLTVNGLDVGSILIGDGLAEPYVCAGTSCPQRRNWC